MSAPPPTLNATSTGCDARRASDRRRWSLLLMSQPSGRSWPKLGASMSAGLTSSKNPRKFMQLFPNLRGSYQCKSRTDRQVTKVVAVSGPWRCERMSGCKRDSAIRSKPSHLPEWPMIGRVLDQTRNSKNEASRQNGSKTMGNLAKSGFRKRSQPPKWRQTRKDGEFTKRSQLPKWRETPIRPCVERWPRSMLDLGQAGPCGHVEETRPVMTVCFRAIGSRVRPSTECHREFTKPSWFLVTLSGPVVSSRTILRSVGVRACEGIRPGLSDEPRRRRSRLRRGIGMGTGPIKGRQRMSDVRCRVWRMSLLVFLGIAGGCGGPNDPSTGSPGAGPQAAGTVLIDGSSTVFRNQQGGPGRVRSRESRCHGGRGQPWDRWRVRPLHS